MRLASRVDLIDASGIRRVFDLAKSLKDPINLSIGQPDFDVPQLVKDATIAAIQAGRNSYTPTQGLAELSEQFRQRETDYTKRELAADQLVTSVQCGLLLPCWPWSSPATRCSFQIRILLCTNIWCAYSVESQSISTLTVPISR